MESILILVFVILPVFVFMVLLPNYLENGGIFKSFKTKKRGRNQLAKVLKEWLFKGCPNCECTKWEFDRLASCPNVIVVQCVQCDYNIRVKI